MTAGPANTLWARAFVDELARCGVREVALAPGSRSTPLVLAFAADGRFRLRVHLDERSAAFFALGVGKASGAPAAVVTTSGTAAANLLPAVVEASQSEAPLLVLTADRPNRLRGADANQAIDQVRLYGPYVRAFHEVGLPALDEASLRHLRGLACRSVADALGAPSGPVHLNFPFEKPLEPVEPPHDFVAAYPLAAWGRPDGAPFVTIDGAARSASPERLGALADLLGTDRGVIVAGPASDPVRIGPAVRDLAARTGFPVLADPLSGARFGPCRGARLVAAYDLFLGDADIAERLAPSVVLRVGASPTSASLLAWLGRHVDVPHVVIDGGGRWKDHAATATRYVHADAAGTLEALAARVAPAASQSWAELWAGADAAAIQALGEVSDEPHEGMVWDAVRSAVPADGSVFVSNSMPVRDLDAFGRTRDEPMLVLGNRGASGIDGIVSTAFGVASQRRGPPTVCVLGDLAFFHDQNGLLWQREPDAHVVFVLVDNDGGGIFHMLPVAAHEPHFTPYVATPHGLDLRHAAQMHGIELLDLAMDELERGLSDALSAGRTTVLRVRTDRVENRRRRAAAIDAARRSVRAVLG